MIHRLPKKVLEGARSFACNLYKQVPGALIPNAGEDALRFVWDNLCDPSENVQEPPLPGLPPKPLPPFEGGQCEFAYTVQVQSINQQGTVQTTTDIYCRGPIGGFSSSFDGTFHNWYLNAYTLQGEYKAAQYYVYAWRPHQFQGTYCRISKITPSSGNVDNCGSLPKKYPDVPPPPPGGYTSPPTPIVLNDNDTTNITFNLVPPVVTSPSLKFPSIVVTVGSPSLKVPVSFEFNGDINIGAPDSAEIDLGDVKNDINDIKNNTNKLPDFFKDFEFNFNPPSFEDSPEVERVDNPPDKEGEKQVEDLLGVLVELTKMPDKSQFGSPTCYFAGWLTFLNQGGYEPRYQINFATGYFSAPLGCTGYAYTFTNGAEGAIREYKKIRED